MRLRLLALLAAVAGSAGAVSAGDWPQWRGPNRDGKSTDTGLAATWPSDGPRLVWSLNAVGDIGTGYGTPAVVGDKLYVLGADGPTQNAREFVTCLSATDGKRVWQTPLKTSPGKFLDQWGGGPRSTPTVDGDSLYVLGATGDLACLSAADGKVVWQKNLVADFGGKITQWGFSESPLVDGDKVVVTPGAGGGMVALNKKTGEVVWQCKECLDQAGYSSIIAADIGGVRQYVQQTMAHGIGVRAQDGKLLWQVGEIGRRTAVIPTPVVSGDIVFFTAGYGAGCEAFKLEPDGQGGTKAAKIYSKNNVVSNHHGGVIEHGGKVYGHSDSKQWVCFDYKTGPDEPTWQSNKLPKGSIGYADGQFYCYSEKDGTLARIKATEAGWEETGRFKIPKASAIRPRQGQVWPHPVIANGKLYLRDFELLYCYDLTNPGA